MSGQDREHLQSHTFLNREAIEILVEALVCDLGNDLTAHLIKHLKLIQNATAQLILNLPKYTHVSPLLCSLHWPSVHDRIYMVKYTLLIKSV